MKFSILRAAIPAVVLALVLTGCRLIPVRAPAPVSKVVFDFGDAPDGGATNYDANGAAVGHFPSSLASNGARTADTGQVWLGDVADQETDSKQINQDSGDDGVRTDFHACAASAANFYVHVANPGQLTGTAYLNLFVDWNKDGRWAGRDDCAAEWAVQNAPVDLSQQTTAIAVVVPTFTAGKQTTDVWYRATVTQGQQLDDSASGEFTAGEVEDYGPGSPGDDSFYDAFCSPDPLKINHGDKGTVQVTRSFWSTADLTDIDFPNGFDPKTDDREITIDHVNRTFTYRSKTVDPPERRVVDPVKIRADFGNNEASTIITCWVEVKHTAKEEPPPTKTTPSPTTTSPTTSTGDTTKMLPSLAE